MAGGRALQLLLLWSKEEEEEEEAICLVLYPSRFQRAPPMTGSELGGRVRGRLIELYRYF